MKYIDKAIGYINTDKNGGHYLTITLKDNFQPGDKIFLRKNKFKKDGDKSPDYKYSVKVEDVEDVEDITNDVPF